MSSFGRRAAKEHGKSMGVSGVWEELEFQTCLLKVGVRYLTGGSDTGYVLSAGWADVKRLPELKLSSHNGCAGTSTRRDNAVSLCSRR
jgi:hypothetical protein